MKVKEESEKSGWTFKTLRSWHPVPSLHSKLMLKLWELTDFIFLGSRTSMDGDGSHEIIRCLLLGRKVMTNLESILKSKDIPLLIKVPIIKVMVFPVVMYGCESWTLKKAEYWRIDAFKLWCWRRLLRVPWTARRPVNPKGNQSWIFIGRTDAEAEAPIFSSPDGKSWLTGKDPDAEKDWGQEEKGMTEDRWLEGVMESMDMSLSKLKEIVKDILTSEDSEGKPGVLQFLGL